MPQVFKALATIMVWVLFISSLFIVAISLIFGTIRGDLFGGGEPLSTSYIMIWGLATVMGILSVCAMKLRQMLE